MDGEPAKVIYYPDRKQTAIYWGGRPEPDGAGRNHATIQDASPDEFHFLRANGRVIVNQSYNPQSKSKFQRDIEAHGGWLGVFRDSLRRAINMYRR